MGGGFNDKKWYVKMHNGSLMLFSHNKINIALMVRNVCVQHQGISNLNELVSRVAHIIAMKNENKSKQSTPT